MAARRLSSPSRKNVFHAITALAASASIATAATVVMASLSRPTSEAGYLLYPRLGLCGPRSASLDEIAAAKAAHRHLAAFRPIRTADAVMPPELGQRLSARWLESGASNGSPSGRAGGK